MKNYHKGEDMLNKKNRDNYKRLLNDDEMCILTVYEIATSQHFSNDQEKEILDNLHIYYGNVEDEKSETQYGNIIFKVKSIHYRKFVKKILMVDNELYIETYCSDFIHINDFARKEFLRSLELFGVDTDTVENLGGE